MLSLLKWLCIAALLLILVLFAVSNRHMVELTLYPLPYKVEVAAYFFVIFFFLAGYIAAWFLGLTSHLRTKTKLKQSNRKVSALEEEVDGLRNNLIR
ncbi:MAG: LapA family protein [Rickettsiales bacterium]|nr:LapA family protein [Rickettsiales bacterium]